LSEDMTPQPSGKTTTTGRIRPSLSTLMGSESTATAYPCHHRCHSHIQAYGYQRVIRPKWTTRCLIQPRHSPTYRMTRTATIRHKLMALSVTSKPAVLAVDIPRAAGRKAFATIPSVQAMTGLQASTDLQVALIALDHTNTTAATTITPKSTYRLKLQREKHVPLDPPTMKSKGSSSCTTARSNNYPGQRSSTNSRNFSTCAAKMDLLLRTIAFDKAGAWNKS
jgi:hypothetical protein